MTNRFPDPTPEHSLQFLKLGGSLITNKRREGEARLEVITRLAREIARARENHPELSLIIGHGSGSFGHVPADKFGTRQGVQTASQWLGFAEVWFQASALNRLVVNALYAAGLPVISLPPSAMVTGLDGAVGAWDLAPLRAALAANLLPVVYGDVIFDRKLGGTIFSTEDLFSYLARQLKPARLLLAGTEPGVWADFPARTRLIDLISPGNYAQVSPALGGSAGTDVTGGMASKVLEMLELVQSVNNLEVCIFSGEVPGEVQRVLLGETSGTVIRLAG